MVNILAIAPMVVGNRDSEKWSSWYRCIALRPAIFSLLLLLVTRGELIQEMIAMFSKEDRICGRRNGVHGANRW